MILHAKRGSDRGVSGGTPPSAAPAAGPPQAAPSGYCSDDGAAARVRAAGGPWRLFARPCGSLMGVHALLRYDWGRDATLRARDARWRSLAREAGWSCRAALPCAGAAALEPVRYVADEKTPAPIQQRAGRLMHLATHLLPHQTRPLLQTHNQHAPTANRAMRNSSCCLAAVELVLEGAAVQGLPACACQPSADAPCRSAAPNGCTVFHALAFALRHEPGTPAAAAPPLPPLPGALLDAELDRDLKYPLHLLLDSHGLQLAGDSKKISKAFARLHGATPLECAVVLGRTGAARVLLAAGASVRPQAWAALEHCPCPLRDCMASLLAASQVRCSCQAMLPSSPPPASSRHAAAGWHMLHAAEPARWPSHCSQALRPCCRTGPRAIERRSTRCCAPLTALATGPLPRCYPRSRQRQGPMGHPLQRCRHWQPSPMTCCCVWGPWRQRRCRPGCGYLPPNPCSRHPELRIWNRNPVPFGCTLRLTVYSPLQSCILHVPPRIICPHLRASPPCTTIRPLSSFSQYLIESHCPAIICGSNSRRKYSRGAGPRR